MAARCVGLLVVGLLMASLWQFNHAAYIYAKAWLAQVLIENAWEKTLNNEGAPQKPWGWADTWPVARLQIFYRNREMQTLYVLKGSAGNSLAFGPGHLSGSTTPGRLGTVIIGAHRDTHFRHMAKLKVSDLIRMQAANGEWRQYRFDTSEVVDVSKEDVALDSNTDQLILVTCYPFNGLLPSGTLRWLGRAVPDGNPI